MPPRSPGERAVGPVKLGAVALLDHRRAVVGEVGQVDGDLHEVAVAHRVVRHAPRRRVGLGEGRGLGCDSRAVVHQRGVGLPHRRAGQAVAAFVLRKDILGLVEDSADLADLELRPVETLIVVRPARADTADEALGKGQAEGDVGVVALADARRVIGEFARPLRELVCPRQHLAASVDALERGRGGRVVADLGRDRVPAVGERLQGQPEPGRRRPGSRGVAGSVVVATISPSEQEGDGPRRVDRAAVGQRRHE